MPRPPSPSPAHARPSAADALLHASLRLGDSLWNDDLALLRMPVAPTSTAPVCHRVRETVWYALGLLARAGDGDVARAHRALAVVLEHQMRAPGEPWDGTFLRAPEEPAPPARDAYCWKHYDPNWRQFIGVAFAQILLQHEALLPAALAERLLASIRHAVEGELASARLRPHYTNIALMHGFLLAFAGTRLGHAPWVADADEWARAVHAAYAPDESFEEYNSPTYYGVDLHGLALWRRHGATDTLRTLGTAMEAGLWRDVGRFYHAGLRTLCGPHDRAYGLDMRAHVASLGLWIFLAVPPELAPLPDPDAGPMTHAHDYLAAPCFATLGAVVPAEALPHLLAFQGQRVLHRRITAQRVATAWLSDRIMLGGELTARTRCAGPGTTWNQFQPATAHWRTPDGGLGWLALREAPPLDARAEPGRLVVETDAGGAAVWIAHAPGVAPGDLTRDRWVFPGLEVHVATDATAFACAPRGDTLALSYGGATRFTLTFTPSTRPD